MLFRSRLSAGLGTPKELEQLQHELASLAKRRSELEDVELEVMVRVEGIDQRISQLSSERDSLAQEIENLKRDKENSIAEIESAIKKTEQDRSDLVSKIEADLLSLYEKIRASGDGIGAARLNGDKCDGCHLTMNSAEITRIKALPDDDVVRCEECRRILIRV